MTLIKALRDTQAFLESIGYGPDAAPGSDGSHPDHGTISRGWDIADHLAVAIRVIEQKYPQVAGEELV